MSETIIRPSTEADLQGIADLFLPRKRDPEVFRYILTNPEGKLQSFVAELDGEIVGHVGYIMSDYRFNDEHLKGVFTIEWIVKEEHAGQAGLALYGKVMKLGDFTFIIGGTEVVNKIYPLLRFTVPIQIPRYLKVLRPLPYMRALKNPLWKRVAKTAYYSKGLISSKGSSKMDIALAPFSNEPILAPMPPNTVFNRELPTHMDWLHSAPDVTPYSFTITRSGLPIGKAICYIRDVNGVVSGRIVHLSFLGEDPALWRETVALLESFLEEKGACVVTCMASHPIFSKVLEERGHIVVKESPLWLRDKPKRFKDKPVQWHFTYLEGDLAWRGVHISDFGRTAKSA